MFEIRPRRGAGIRMSYETAEGEQAVVLVFEGIEALRVTYDRARGDTMLEAYDRLVDQGGTEWLGEILGNLRQHGGGVDGLAHLMINFDDGPCYEVICRSHRLETSGR